MLLVISLPNMLHQVCVNHLPADQDCKPRRLEGSEDHCQLRRPLLRHLCGGEEDPRCEEIHCCPRSCRLNTTKMVKNTDFNEEVTKHSVHTLVFRSLKRTHDMFVSDQGNLPDIDKEAEALLWKVKSKSVYGQVQQKVDQVRREIV